jgi:hypothetical protein
MGEHKGDQEVDGVLYARDIQFKLGKHGDILYKHRGEWKKLHIGNLGDVLTVDVDGFPSWAPPALPAFNDYFMQTFGNTDQVGAGAGSPQPDIPAGVTTLLLHDGYYSSGT